jgi:hypothetical protein
MQNFTWVCFDCKASYRRGFTPSEVRCGICGKECAYLGTKVPIPRRANVTGWAALRGRYFENEREYERQWYEARRQATHETEREIARLEALPPNAGRRSAVKRLRKRLPSPVVVSR